MGRRTESVLGGTEAPRKFSWEIVISRSHWSNSQDILNENYFIVFQTILRYLFCIFGQNFCGTHLGNWSCGDLYIDEMRNSGDW